MRVVALVGAFALVSSCGPSGGESSTTATVGTVTTTSISPVTTSTTAALSTTTSPSTTEPPDGPFQEIAYMLHESGGNETRPGPFLAPVVRNTGSLEDTVREALYRLSPSERDIGLTTAIPEGSDLHDIVVDDGIATVDLTSEFDDGGGSFSMQARLAQLVYTVTAYDPAITGVRLHLDGVPVDVFSAEGIVLDDPMTREGFRDLLPGILVESPGYEAWVRPPLTVTGIAAAFEGVFQLEILDGAGDLVVDVPFVQTDNGAGWGSFSVTFEESDLPAMPADLQIRVYELSAKDGSVINERIQPIGYRMRP